MPQPQLHRTLVSGICVVLAMVGLLVLPSSGTLVGAASAATTSEVWVGRLTVNGRENPLGIPLGAPSLSWYSMSPGRGIVQTAYQIRVGLSRQALETSPIWDTGKRVSAQQVDVAYEGPQLTSQTRYYWQVRVWDGNDLPSNWSNARTFETGQGSVADWGGAEWIGPEGEVAGGSSFVSGSTRVPDAKEAQRWTNYTASFTFKIDKAAFAAHLRSTIDDYDNTPGGDPGLLWQVSVANGRSYFRPHFGYQLLESKDITDKVSAADLVASQHTLRVRVTGYVVETWLDDMHIDTRAVSQARTQGWVGVRTAIGEEATVSRINVVSASGATLLDTDFSANNPLTAGTRVTAPTASGWGLKVQGNLNAMVVVPQSSAMPLMRTQFATRTGTSIIRARIYATGLGIYQLSLNGRPVGNSQRLAPGWTDYRRRVQHQTYDVTNLLRDGGQQNAWGAEVTRGWWAGRIAYQIRPSYGSDLSLLARLRIDYADGTTQWVDTDDSTWKTRRGPRAAADLIDGEWYDNRVTWPGWDQPGYDDSGWFPVRTRQGDTFKVVPQPDDPVRVTQRLSSTKVSGTAPGPVIYDVGQNMVGVVKVTMSGTPGSKAIIRHAEALKPDGTLYTENLDGAQATDTFVFDSDGTVTYEPMFTTHGFRYVQITGAQSIQSVEGVAIGSDLRATGHLTTSDPMINKLLSNITWGLRDNFVSIPTDTPARDERLGWTGDIQAFAPTASYLRDTRAFLGKWLVDLRDSQESNGDFPAYAPGSPYLGTWGGTGWSDAGIMVPYALWEAYGDASVIRENWQSMTKYFSFLRGITTLENRVNFGDWMNTEPAGYATPKGVMAVAYYAEMARMMSEMATATDLPAEAADYAAVSAEQRARFTRDAVGPEGTVYGHTQTGYALALAMDLVPQDRRAQVGQWLVNRIEALGNRMTTGFIGTPYLLPALSSIGRDDVAWRLLKREEYPSWLYEVKQGATTMWERWDGIKPDGTYGGAANNNSFNHYAYGAVGKWMYERIGGITPAAPGYQKIRIEPRPGGGVTSADAVLETSYGTIGTGWTLEDDGTMKVTVEVPVNTTTEVVLPASGPCDVQEGGVYAGLAPGVTGVSFADGKVTIKIGSGSYHFTVRNDRSRLETVKQQVAAAKAEVERLRQAGDLGSLSSSVVQSRLTAASSYIDSAIGGLDDGCELVWPPVNSAINEVRGARSWIASTGLPASVAALRAQLATPEEGLSQVLSDLIGVYVELEDQPATPRAPGSEIASMTFIDNLSSSELTNLRFKLQVRSWPATSWSITTPVPADGDMRLSRSTPVPSGASPGSHDAEVALTMSWRGTDIYLTDLHPDWVVTQ